MHTDEPFYSARQLFPRGLEQPEGSLRFGADALLLAAFAARYVESLNASRQAHLTAAELGCGCGAALLGLALRCAGITGLGLDTFTPAHLALGVLCGVCGELYGYWRQMPGHDGARRLIGSGNGLRKNPLLRRIFSDTFGMPLQVPLYEEEAAYGVALLLTHTLGMHPTLRQAQALIPYQSAER